MSEILDVTPVCKELTDCIEGEIKRTCVRPVLAYVWVGEISRYSEFLKKDCERVGIGFESYFAQNQEDLLAKIEELNSAVDTSGILLQLPFPKGIDGGLIVGAINKDVDGITPDSFGYLRLGREERAPAVVRATIRLLDYYEIPVKGRDIVIINNQLIGQAMALLLSGKARFATATICHEFTGDLERKCQNADMVVTAVGKEGFSLKPEMIKDGAVVIDLGTGYKEGRLYRDILEENYVAIAEKASFITDNKKGVGYLTRTEILLRTLELSKPT